MIDRGNFLGGMTTAFAAPLFQPPSYALSLGIGVVVPQSGDARPLGDAVVRGVRAAVDDANQTRLALDKYYAVRVFDDQNSPASGIVAAGFALADQTLVAVIGHLSGAVTTACLRTYAESGMPLVVPASTDDAITEQNYHNFVRLPTRDFDEGLIHARFVAKRYAPKHALALTQDGDYGPDVVNGYAAGLNALKIPNEATIFGIQNPDYAGAVDAVIKANPDHLLLAGNVGDMGPVLPLLRDRGYKGSLSASQGFFDGALVAKYAAPAEGIIVSTSMPYLALAPSAYRVVSDYQRRYGPFIPLTAFAYAAAQVIIATAHRTGATARNTILQGMTTGQNVDTVVGPFRFGGTGDPTDPNLYFYTVKGGALSYVQQAHPSGFLAK
ncbi:MAG: branched-chain amino acid ABC transporter substrate-binding protein [Candidatus Velthaea sp.]|jgi:branched-chain amino acid transport system substrate-binding protein